MSRTTSKHPTELELEILKVLWRVGPATVRQLRDELAAVRDLAYTTVMTMMTIMDTKGYVTRVKDGRSFIYEATYHEQKASRNMLQDVVDRLRRIGQGRDAASVGNVRVGRSGTERDPVVDQPQGPREVGADVMAVRRSD